MSTKINPEALPGASILQNAKIIGQAHTVRIQSPVPLDDKKITFTRYLSANKSYYVRKYDENGDVLSRRERHTVRTRKWTRVPTISTHPTTAGWGGPRLEMPLELSLLRTPDPDGAYPYYLYEFTLKATGEPLTTFSLIGFDPNSGERGYFVSVAKPEERYQWHWGKTTKSLYLLDGSNDWSQVRAYFKAGFDIEGVVIPFAMQAVLQYNSESGKYRLCTSLV